MGTRTYEAAVRKLDRRNARLIQSHKGHKNLTKPSNSHPTPPPTAHLSGSREDSSTRPSLQIQTPRVDPRHRQASALEPFPPRNVPRSAQRATPSSSEDLRHQIQRASATLRVVSVRLRICCSSAPATGSCPPGHHHHRFPPAARKSH